HHELTYYKSLVDSCKQALLQCQQQPTSGSGVVPAVDRPYPTSMHYTFDWYTTVSLPYSSRLNEKIILSYMPSGHSRSWNDLFMGVFKKKFRNCDVNSLQDVYQIAERCCGPSNSITPVLVGNDSGDIEFPLLDWNEKFSHINNLDASILTANNHFEISNEVPGLVLCRR
ncbi:unnamed protein product, partial [Medioppia subpectinata]